MSKPPRYIVRSIVPLILIFCIVLIGFSLIITRQNKLHSLEQKIDLQIHNVMAKKELGDLIVGDLRKVATHFYMSLISADQDRQELLLSDVKLTIAEIHAALDLLSTGGTLSVRSSLKLPSKDTLHSTISYTLKENKSCSSEVVLLRPELTVLEEQLEKSIAVTTINNQLLKKSADDSLQKVGLQLRSYAKDIHLQLERMTESANKISSDANQELMSLKSKFTAAQHRHQRVELLWIIATILCVIGFVGVIIATRGRLKGSIQQLQQTEHDLQASHTEVLALNQSLEEQIVVRTKELEASERLWATAFDAVALPVFLHNQKGRILKVNQAYLDLAECTFEDAFGRFYWEVFPKQESALPGCLENSPGKGVERQIIEQDVLIDDKIFRSQSFAIYDAQGLYLYSMHYMEDVTEKRKISIALQESEKRFREVTNSLNDVLILIDTDLKVQLLNNAAITAYGVTDKNYIGKSCHEVFWNCGDVCENCPTLETMRTGKTFRAMRYMEDGTILDRTICPVHDQAGKIIASAIIASDVTERERQIEKLKRFEQIMSTSTDLIAFFDGQHRYLAANSEYANYFGISVDEIIGKHAAEVLGKDRYAWFLPYGETVFGEGKPVTLTTWIDYPVVGKRYMEVNLTPYLDGDGQVTGFVSRTVDITEKHEQDAKLRLSAAVFESTIEGIVITDADGVILAINQAFSEITGYTEADVLGENPRILKSDQHDTTFYQNMWQSLIDNGKWRGEVWNRRKTGEIYPELMTISSIRNDEGETINYVAVFTDITASKQAEDQLKYQAHHHPLTGLPNRLLLFARLEHSIQHVKRERERGAVMFLDLDNFKKVNDSLGHKAGDEVLKEVASRLQKGSREVDTVAHLGGDEFVIVMQSIRTVRDATTRAQQILDSLQKPFIVETYELYVSGSIGITEFTGAGENLESLLKNADSAMYKAKEEGKNCYQIYSSDLTEAAIEKVLLETHLRRALERNELVLHYQPQVDLPNGNIVAMEALVRWQHPDLGLLAPDKFISLSEETGLIIPMGEWILKTACEQLLIWRKQGYNLRRIAVNLSGKQIQQKNLLEVVERILLETGCPPDSLELEITEGFIMQHPEQSISVLQQIRALGVELSIDDFGTGHSSLNYLRRLPISRLKIDRTFVWDIGESSDGEAITKAVIAMGQSLNLQITAEGIETPEQRKFVEEHGCNEAQGYKFSRPLPAGEVSVLLESATLGSAEVT